MERPEVNSALSSLADFQSVRFHDLRLAGSDLTTSYATPAYMVNTTTKIIAYPGKAVATTTGSFIDYYGTPLPTVTSVSPSQGSTAGGTTVTITGTYLVPGLVESVHFGADVAHGDIYPDGTIVVTAPAEPAGTVAVTVTTTDGSSQSTGANRFTYVTPSPPSSTPPSSTPPPSPTPPSPTPPSPPTSAPTPGPSAASTTSGYDMVGSDGGVFVFPAGQTAGYHGSLPGDDVQVSDVVGMVPTPSDAGYFLVGSDGGVFSFGTRRSLGRYLVITSRSTTSRASFPLLTTAATSSSGPTAASSPLATRRSSVRCRAAGSTPTTSSALRRRRTTRGTGWSREQEPCTASETPVTKDR